MRLLFLGSPAPAVPFLEECVRSHEVAAVLTQPDRPCGRGLKDSAPPVKTAALRLGIPVLQPGRPEECAQELRRMQADMAVVVAYGRMLDPDVLSCTRHGFLNVHFSLLPRWRGAAPVQWTLLGGDARAGVTLFWIDNGMDTGPMQRQAAETVLAEDDACTLMERLTALGVRELREVLGEVASGVVRRTPQSGESTRAPKLDSSYARLAFDLSAQEFCARVRGLAAGPRPYLMLSTPKGPLRVKVLRAALDSPDAVGNSKGLLVRVERGRGVLVECRLGRVWIEEVQPEGKTAMSAVDFLNGLRIGIGGRLEIIP
ncbi:MAG: methionyl-tRNA formyltransferase [Elusimicrobiota bacterium]|jgi:methionyl-tRNA formyltransferase